jgi:hypothetical protein
MNFPIIFKDKILYVPIEHLGCLKRKSLLKQLGLNFSVNYKCIVLDLRGNNKKITASSSPVYNEQTMSWTEWIGTIFKGNPPGDHPFAKKETFLDVDKFIQYMNDMNHERTITKW